MKKPLYLVEKGNKVTVHRDGPSLLITSRNKAPMRIPVRKIDKVVIIGNIRIDANSIILCAENKIPVLFITPDNTEKALILPYNHKLPKHYKEQRLILQSQETMIRYKKWIYTRRSIMQLKILKELFKGFSFPHEIGEGNYQFLIRNFSQRHQMNHSHFCHSERSEESQSNWIMVKDIIENFLRAIILGRIIQAGLDPHLGIIHKRVNFGLLLDLFLIFEPEADFQTIKFFQSTKSSIHNGELTEVGVKQIIDRFESRRESFTQSVETVIDELFEIIKDLRK
jgi:CRISPR/Cas system-associated endonuclease Cas1